MCNVDKFESVSEVIMEHIENKGLKNIHIRNFVRNIMLYSGVVSLIILFGGVILDIIFEINIFFDSGDLRFSWYLAMFFSFLVVWIAITFMIPKSCEISKMLMSLINSNIELVERKASACYELYAGFEDEFNRMELKNYMEYELNNSTKVKMGDINLKYHVGMKMGTIGVFEGTIAKLSRDKNIPNDIFIEYDKFYKSPNKVKSFFTTWPDFSKRFSYKERRIKSNHEFEKHFNLYALDKIDAEIRLSEYVKDEILKLYKKYKIVFEISASGKEVYIRFFRDKFLNDAVMTKKGINKQYREISAMLNIIDKINEIL